MANNIFEPSLLTSVLWFQRHSSRNLLPTSFPPKKRVCVGKWGRVCSTREFPPWMMFWFKEFQKKINKIWRVLYCAQCRDEARNYKTSLTFRDPRTRGLCLNSWGIAQGACRPYRETSSPAWSPQVPGQEAWAQPHEEAVSMKPENMWKFLIGVCPSNPLPGPKMA